MQSDVPNLESDDWGTTSISFIEFCLRMDEFLILNKIDIDSDLDEFVMSEVAHLERDMFGKELPTGTPVLPRHTGSLDY